jgi:PAS domain S-box-containing protein
MTDHETVAPRPEPSAGQFADLPFLRGEVAFRLLVEAVQDYAIFLLGPDGRVLTWNLGAQRIKGYTADEIIGQHFSRFYTPEEREAGRPMYLLGLAAEYGRFEDEGWRVRKDGTRFWADVILTALRDEDGVPYAYAKVTRDLTERRAAEERERSLLVEREARAAAEQALQVRDRFMSIASHELKTPAATLGLVVQSLLHARTRGTLDDTRLETGLRRIGLAAQRLGTLVDELLDVSRLTSGRLPIDRQPLDLVELTREVIDRFDAAEQGSRFRLDAPPDGAPIQGDPSRLDQVLSNLLDNAVKYSDLTAVIDAEVRRDGEGFLLSVADRGIGLDAEASSRLFEAFARGLNTEHIPGLGLGLYISQQIVERHGGRITATARGDGAGSRFSVWLPAADAPGVEG